MRIDVSSFQQWPKVHRDARDGFADTTSLAAHFGVQTLAITSAWIGFVRDFGREFLGVEDATHSGRTIQASYSAHVYRIGAYVVTDVASAEEIRRLHQRAVSEAKRRAPVTDVRSGSGGASSLKTLYTSK